MRHQARKVRAKVTAIHAGTLRRRTLAVFALAVVVAAIVAAAGPASPAEASHASPGSARTAARMPDKMQSGPRSRTITIRLVRKVDAAKLPEPKITKPESEPVETNPKHLKPRTTGIVTAVLHGKGRGRGTRAESPAISQGVSVTGQQIDGTIPPDTQVAAGGAKGQ